MTDADAKTVGRRRFGVRSLLGRLRQRGSVDQPAPIGDVPGADRAELDLVGGEEEPRLLAPTGKQALASLLLLGLVSLIVQGGVLIQKSWLWTGDIIYHRALMAEVLNGELLPGGPYDGLPAFYSPLYHYAAAALAALFSADPLDGVRLLSIAAAPLTPLVAYYFARRLKFDRGVALLGAFFATFGGGLRLIETRVWVDSLFVGQHNFFPLFPRDAAFLLLPLGLVWIHRGVVGGWRPGSILAGITFGLMILVHTQTAVFVAPVLSLYLVAAMLVRRELIARAVRGAVICGGVALGISSFWWVWELVAIVRGGSFSVQMPAYRVPVKLSWQEAPLDFGVFLVLGVLGVLLTVRRGLRQRDLAALLLLVWWAAPTLLAIFRPTGFPGGDTFFPRRLWQFASQPAMLMSAYALLAGVLRPLRWDGRPGAIVLIIVGALAGIPNSWGTWQRIGEFWNTASFADVDWDLNGNFRYGAWLEARARNEGIRTVLAPTPDSTLVWYRAGEKVVYLYPTAAIKLAFDVRRLTGHGVDEREADLITAYGGRPESLAEVARKYAATYLVLRRDGDNLGLVDLPATALRGGKNNPKMIETNHYEFFSLGEGDGVRFEFFSPVSGPATVSLRARRRSIAPRVAAHLIVNGNDYPVTEGEAERDEYAELTRVVPVQAGGNEVRFQAAGTFELARFVGYTVTVESLLDRFAIAYEDPYTVILTPR